MDLAAENARLTALVEQLKEVDAQEIDRCEKGGCQLLWL